MGQKGGELMKEQNDYSKFLSLEHEKQERILNAAMKEFLIGFKKASTDNIVRDAGISKGLLFHYFGTKEKLYNFLIDYAVDTIRHEYIDLVNVMLPDLLDSIWQTSLLKQDLSLRYPAIFDFLTAAYLNEKKQGTLNEKLKSVVHMQQETIEKIYAYADKSLFRGDICAHEAMKLITLTLHGFAHARLTEADNENPGSFARENYEKYLEELQGILTIFRKTFYK